MLDTDIDLCAKDTVLSILVVCSIHARKGGCHTAEKLKEKEPDVSVNEMYSPQDNNTSLNKG